MSATTWTWIGGTVDLKKSIDWVISAGPGNLSGIPQTGDTVINAGTQAGYGLLAASLVNSGTVVAASGGLEIQGAVSGTGTMIVAPGATLRIDGTLGPAQTIAFSPGAPESLILASPAATIANPITGFAAGDRIEFAPGIMIAAASLLGGNTLEVAYLDASGTPGTYDLTDIAFAPGGPQTFAYANVDPETGDAVVAPANFIGWTGATSTDFGTGANWNFGGVAPGALDVAYFDDGIGGMIGGTGSVEVLYFTNPGTWSLAPGTSLSATSDVSVGAGMLSSATAGALTIGTGATVATPGGFITVAEGTNGTATLTVAGGGVLQETAATLPTEYAMYIGSDPATGTLPGSSGQVLVTGTGSLIDLGFNGLDLGDTGGRGTLTISAGGSVVAATPDSSQIAALALGRQGTGSVTVTGAGSQLTADGVVSAGRAGSGSLTVSSQGSMTIGLDSLGVGGLFVGGYGTDASNTLYAGSSGTAIVSTGGNLYSQGSIQIGGNGDSGLMILVGGTVVTEGQLLFGNSITLGAGATLITPTGTTAVTAPMVESGNGQIIISAGTVQAQGLAEKAGSTISLLSGNLLIAGTGTAAGLITGSGTIAGQFTSTGSIVANRGTLDFTGGLLGTGTITINAGSALRSDGELGNGLSVNFATSTSAEDLILGTPQAANAFSIGNWQTGDEIVFTGATTISGAQWLGGGTLAVDSSAGILDFTNVTLAAGAAPIFATGSNFVELVPCFAAGTRIATPQGEVAVEHLSAGDLVLTLTGKARPIVWIGTGRALATPGRRNAATPVIVCKGALADNVPNRDLHVTKGHSLYIDGVLIPAEFLVNHRSILWDDRARVVEVYHIELQTHDVLFADGAPAETYRDDGNRWLFQNANTGWEQPPPPPCAPVLTGGPQVDAIWRRLLDRAGKRPGLPTTDDPDLHLLADGKRVDGEPGPFGIHRFRFRHRPAEIRVVSRAGAPAELGLARDPRPLGVALRGIRLWRGPDLRLMDASDPSLEYGFHPFEPDNGFRWTDGDALLPATLFDGVNSAFNLELHVSGSARYPLFGDPVRMAAA